MEFNNLFNNLKMKIKDVFEKFTIESFKDFEYIWNSV